jgi:hypothetical protein
MGPERVVYNGYRRYLLGNYGYSSILGVVALRNNGDGIGGADVH